MRCLRCVMKVLCVSALLILFYLHYHYAPQTRRAFSTFQQNFYTHSQRIVRREFKTREKCQQLYGKVLFFVMYRQSSLDQGYYAVAQETMKCYLKGTDYSVAMVDIDNDERVQEACGHHEQLFFKKHCAAAEYLQDADWMLVLDADTGVVNPHHCIEEWIDPRVDLLFYERFFNWEIASGNYIARNSQFAYDFLKKWAEWEFIQPPNWNGADNGVLQLHILQTVIPDAVQESKNCEGFWRNGTGYDTYMAYVTCVKLALGATRLWPGKIRIYRRAHGWVRDGFLTSDRWGPSDFMLHGWKLQHVGKGWDGPFQKDPNSTECGFGDEGWNWREQSRIGDKAVRVMLANFERSSGRNFPKEARVIPHLQAPDVGDCYPHCEDDTDRL